MSQEEYRSWQSYYKLEPFGYQNDEYRWSFAMMMINNSHISKRRDAKRASHFFRDSASEVKGQISNAEKREQFLNASEEEKSSMIAASFSGMGIKVKVDNGNSSHGISKTAS